MLHETENWRLDGRGFQCPLGPRKPLPPPQVILGLGGEGAHLSSGYPFLLGREPVCEEPG